MEHKKQLAYSTDLSRVSRPWMADVLAKLIAMGDVCEVLALTHCLRILPDRPLQGLEEEIVKYLLAAYAGSPSSSSLLSH